MNEYSGEIEDIRNFDTWFYGGTIYQNGIADYLDRIVPGRIAMVAMADYNVMGGNVISRFKTQFGSLYADLAIQWDNWAMITRKGLAASLAENWDGSTTAYPVPTQKSVSLLSYPERVAPVGAPVINSGAASAVSPLVTLDLSGVTDAGSGMVPGGKMRFSNDNVNWSEAEDFQTSKVWYLSRGSGAKTVYAKFRDRSGTWSPVRTDTITFNEAVPVQQLTNAVRPFNTNKNNICSDSNGNIYLAHERDYKLYGLYSNNQGATWSAETLLYSGSELILGEPSISCGDDGHVYVVFNRADYPNDDILFISSSDYGHTWQTTQIKLNPANSKPAIYSYYNSCADDNGNINVIWVEERSGRQEILVNVSNDYGRTWLAEAHAVHPVGNGPNASIPEPMQIACNNQNEVYVLWEAGPSGSEHLRMNYSYDGGRTWPVNDTFLYQDRYSTDNLKMITDDTGHVYIAWSGLVDGYFTVSSDHGRTWSPPVKVNTTRYPWSYDIAADNYGNVYAAWGAASYNPLANLQEIYFNRSTDYGKTWLPQETRVDTNSYTSYGNIKRAFVIENVDVKTNDNGVVSVSWQDHRSYLKGEAEDMDVFTNYSVDMGRTWLSQDIKLTRKYPAWAATEPRTFLINDRVLSFWWERTSPTFSNSIVYDADLFADFRTVVLNHRPQFGVIDNKSVVEGETLTFNVSATDSDGGALTMTATLADGSPLTTIGASFVDNGNGTGTFQWAPTVGGAVNDYSIVFHVTDTIGLHEDKTVTVNVKRRAQMTSPVTTAALAKASVIFNWNAGAATEYKFAWGRSPLTDSSPASNLGTKLTTTINGIRLDGKPLYVRVWSKIDNIWYYQAYTYSTILDNQAPSVPANLRTTAISHKQISVAWNPSTDNSGEIGYSLQRKKGPANSTEPYASLVGTLLTTFTDGVYAPVAPSTTYTYRVQAYDRMQNRSAYSAALTVTTPPDPNPISTKFSVNDRVRTTVAVDVNDGPSISVDPVRESVQSEWGYIQEGPSFADGYWWWEVNFDDLGITGWVIENYLAIVD